MTDAHQHAGRGWQRLAQVTENHGKLRQHIREQNGDRQPTDRREQDGVRQGGLDLVLHLLRALQIFSQALQDDVKEPAEFPGLYHIDVQRGKNLRIFSQRLS